MLLIMQRTAWTVFHRNSSQSDADKVRTIMELLSVKAGLVALSSFDASQVDFMIRFQLRYQAFSACLICVTNLIYKTR